MKKLLTILFADVPVNTHRLEMTSDITVNGPSFTISSTYATETSTLNWWIIN